MYRIITTAYSTGILEHHLQNFPTDLLINKFSIISEIKNICLASDTQKRKVSLL